MLRIRNRFFSITHRFMFVFTFFKWFANVWFEFGCVTTKENRMEESNDWVKYWIGFDSRTSVRGIKLYTDSSCWLALFCPTTIFVRLIRKNNTNKWLSTTIHHHNTSHSLCFQATLISNFCNWIVQREERKGRNIHSLFD